MTTKADDPNKIYTNADLSGPNFPALGQAVGNIVTGAFPDRPTSSATYDTSTGETIPAGGRQFPGWFSSRNMGASAGNPSVSPVPSNPSGFTAHNTPFSSGYLWGSFNNPGYSPYDFFMPNFRNMNNGAPAPSSPPAGMTIEDFTKRFQAGQNPKATNDDLNRWFPNGYGANSGGIPAPPAEDAVTRNNREQNEKAQAADKMYRDRISQEAQDDRVKELAHFMDKAMHGNVTPDQMRLARDIGHYYTAGAMSGDLATNKAGLYAAQTDKIRNDIANSLFNTELTKSQIMENLARTGKTNLEAQWLPQMNIMEMLSKNAGMLGTQATTEKTKRETAGMPWDYTQKMRNERATKGMDNQAAMDRAIMSGYPNMLQNNMMFAPPKPGEQPSPAYLSYLLYQNRANRNLQGGGGQVGGYQITDPNYSDAVQFFGQ